MVVEDKRGTEEAKLSPLARELFALLRHRSEVDRRVVYDGLVARLSAAPTSERPARRTARLRGQGFEPVASWFCQVTRFGSGTEAKARAAEWRRASTER